MVEKYFQLIYLIGYYFIYIYIGFNNFIGKKKIKFFFLFNPFMYFINLIYYYNILIFHFFFMKCNYFFLLIGNLFLFNSFSLILLGIFFFFHFYGNFYVFFFFPFFFSFFYLIFSFFFIDFGIFIGNFFYNILYLVILFSIFKCCFFLNDFFFIGNFFIFFHVNNNFVLNLSVQLNLLNMSFILLTFLIFFAALIGWEVDLLVGFKSISFFGEFLGVFLISIISISMIFFFIVGNVFIMFIFFELTIFPIVILLWLYGSNDGKKSLLYFIIYTSLSSLLFMIFSFVIFNFSYMNLFFDINLLLLPPSVKYALFLFLFFMVAIKAPLYPFHIWLPEAHVESPTAGSVLLAGILLKAGVFLGYGFFIESFFSFFIQYEWVYLILISLFSAMYSLFVAFVQSDLKGIIAYLSISHMSLALIGVWSSKVSGFVGCFYLLFAHGLISSGFFLLIGFFYTLFGIRFISEFRSLLFNMPLFSILFLILLLNNLSIPGTLIFKAEFFLFLSISEFSWIFMFLFVIIIFLNGVLTVYLISRLFFGSYRSLLKKEIILIGLFHFNFFGFNKFKFILFGLYFWIFFSIMCSFFLGIGAFANNFLLYL